jgi:hypothetical protein
MPREVTAFIKPMILTLYVAAARAAASNDQVLQLQERVLPAMEQYRRYELDEGQVMDLVDEVMGGPWDLPEDFSGQLVALGFTRGDSGQ